MYLYSLRSTNNKKVIILYYLKYLNLILPVIVIVIFLLAFIGNYKKRRVTKEILCNPVYFEGTITEIVPDTPSKLGVVNIEVDYEFKAVNGTTYRNKHARTVIKTMDLYNYKIGTKVPIVYLKTDPSRNMLNMKNEIPH